jgi:hypothetical protein
VFEALRQWDYPALKCRGQLTQYHWENVPGGE